MSRSHLVWTLLALLTAAALSSLPILNDRVAMYGPGIFFGLAVAALAHLPPLRFFMLALAYVVVWRGAVYLAIWTSQQASDSVAFPLAGAVGAFVCALILAWIARLSLAPRWLGAITITGALAGLAFLINNEQLAYGFFAWQLAVGLLLCWPIARSSSALRPIG